MAVPSRIRPTTADKGSNFVSVVTGLPRSGTSLLMQMLAAGGCPILADGVRAADADNPRGYFECERVKSLPRDHSWLDAANGRAVKVVHLLVKHLPTDGRHRFRVILIERRMSEVLASQRAMLARLGRPGADLDDARLAAIYAAQLAGLREWLRAQSHFTLLEIAHETLLSNGFHAVERIAEFLGGRLDVAAMAAAIRPELWRQRA